MPKIVPTKNIDSFLVDVRRPGGNYRHKPKLVNLSGLTPPPLILYRHSRFGFAVVFLVVIAVVAGAGFFGIVNYRELSASLREKFDSILFNFSSSIQSLKDFQPEQAVGKLQENDILLAGLEETLDKYGGLKIINALSAIVPNLKEAAGLLNEAQGLNKTVLRASELLSDLKFNGFHYFQNDGPVLLAKLRDLKTSLAEAGKRAELIQNSAATLKDLSPALEELNALVSQQYLAHNSELYRWADFLDGLISFLGRDEVHLALFFQNPSEIRPAGGFLGSYADLTVRQGQLDFLDVRDIYDPEGQLDLKVVPPEPLQVTTHIWGARDANWFFDFPTSAAKVLYFLESSKLYQEQNREFEAVIALNINVLKGVLGLVGPVPLSEYDLVIDENNFLKEIQREVEAGDDKKAGYPKRILKVLTPILLEKIQNLDSDGKEKLSEMLRNNFEQKDIMLFAGDKSLQDFFVGQNVGGAVYQLPHNFFGTYLAVVDANIEGGKSDAFVEQELEAETTLDTNGGSFTNLVVRRTHSGDKEKDPWWRRTNQNYLQVFSSSGSSLVSVKGSTKKPAKFREVNYEALDYAVDADVKKMEENDVFVSNYQTWVGEAFGKTVFGTWFSVPAGQTKELEVRYQTPAPLNVTLAGGKTYQFIYEKQSGVPSRLSVKINAPFGYSWRESGRSVFTQTYEPEAIPGRLILNLTLQKNER